MALAAVPPSPSPEPSARPEAALRCEARRVKKSFGETPILREVDLSIEEGSFAVLVGPSGCGKSTLLRIVAGLEEVDSGEVRLAGRDVTHLPPRDRDVAMVFQSYALYPHLSVRENLAFGLKLRGVAAREIEARIQEASAMLSLGALLDRLPKELSGGQRQRVAMGRAIVRRPALFLFDEPLSNLDAALRAEVRVEIRRQHDKLGATTLYVTHDQVEAMTLADTLWVMNGGKVEQRGAPLSVYLRPRTRFVAGFLGSPQMNFLGAVLHADGGQWRAKGDGFSAPADPARFGAALTEGKKVTLGVRPHDLVAPGPRESGAVAAGSAGDARAELGTLEIDIVEALGFEAFAHGTLGSRGPQAPRLVVRLEGERVRQARPGDALRLAVAADAVHLFDPATGVALDAARDG